MLLSMAIDDFLTIHAKGLSPHTERNYTWQLERFLAYCASAGVLDAEALTAATVARYLDDLRTHPTAWGKPLSSRSLRAYTKNLKVFIGWLVQEEYAPPRALRFELPRAESTIPATLTVDEVRSLLHACRESREHVMQARDTALLLLMLDTGMRVAEVCNLRVEHVRLDADAHVLVLGKGRKWREVGPLGKRTVRAMRAYLTTRRPRQLANGTRAAADENHFFLGRTGVPLRPEVVGKLLTRLKLRAGLADLHVTPHTFRHSWARMRAEHGTDTLVISRLMGHNSLQTTSLYLGRFQSADARKRVTSLVDSSL